MTDEIPSCGVCEGVADCVATVLMVGERPRYPMCLDYLVGIGAYAEDVTMIGAATGRKDDAD